MEKVNRWWAYLHHNGSVQVKRWHGDVDDYTTDCKGNPFVDKVMEPFEADNEGIAFLLALRYLTGTPSSAINTRPVKSCPDEIPIAFC